MNLEMEIGQTGTIYRCPSGHHDDLAISCAMLVWAAQHPHLQLLDARSWSRACACAPTGAKCARVDIKFELALVAMCFSMDVALV